MRFTTEEAARYVTPYKAIQRKRVFSGFAVLALVFALLLQSLTMGMHRMDAAGFGTAKAGCVGAGVVSHKCVHMRVKHFNRHNV